MAWVFKGIYQEHGTGKTHFIPTEDEKNILLNSSSILLIVGVLLQQVGLGPFHALNHICSVQPGHPLCPYGVSNAQHDGDSLHHHDEDTLCVKPSIQLHRNLLIRAVILHHVHLLLGHPQHVHLEHAQENCCQLAGIFVHMSPSPN